MWYDFDLDDLPVSDAGWLGPAPSHDDYFVSPEEYKARWEDALDTLAKGN